MLKSSIRVAAVTAALTLSAVGLAHAQHGPGEWHHDPLFAGVTLTDSQKSQIAALRRSDWAANKPLLDQVRALDQQIDAALLSSGNVSEATLAPLVQKKQSLMQQLELARLSHEIAVRNLLTEPQRAAAASAHAQLAALHEQERKLLADRAAPDAPPAAAD